MDEWDDYWESYQNPLFCSWYEDYDSFYDSFFDGEEGHEFWSGEDTLDIVKRNRYFQKKLKPKRLGKITLPLGLRQEFFKKGYFF